MDKIQALQRIIDVLKSCESDIESVLDDLWQRAYDEGYNDGYEQGERDHHG